VELPANQQAGIETLAEPAADSLVPETPTASQVPVSEVSATTASVEPVERPETPSTQDLPSESTQSTSPTTPASVQTTQISNTADATPTKPTKAAPKTAVPAVPVVPVLPKSSPKDAKTVPSTEKSVSDNTPITQESTAEKVADTASAAGASAPEVTVESAPAPAPVKPKPTSWASLLSSGTPATSNTARTVAAPSTTNGTGAVDGATAAGGPAGAFTKSNTSSLAEALRAFQVTGGSKLAFLEPRGLINTGNMCYMNSVSRYTC
jgi:ubiquitin carboxyl-terminal hydrolase 10